MIDQFLILRLRACNKNRTEILIANIFPTVNSALFCRIQSLFADERVAFKPESRVISNFLVYRY